MSVFTPPVVWSVLLCALLSADASPPGPLKCAPQELPNMTIDVSYAVANGARFTDPLKAASEEQCVSTCCSMLNSAGDAACNLVVYDARSSNPVQNCYLFLCPHLESCPMTHSTGVRSYLFWPEKEKSNLDSTKEDLQVVPESNNHGKVQNSSGKKPSLAVQSIVSAEADIEEELSQQNSAKKNSLTDVRPQSKASEVKRLPKEDEVDTPDHITSQLLHLANDLDKRLEKIEASSKEQTKHSESVDLPVSPMDEKPLVEETTISRRKDSKTLPSDTKDAKSSMVVKKKPETLEVYYPTPELSTLAPFVKTHYPIPKIKPTTIPSSAPSKKSQVAKIEPSSGTKNAKVPQSHDSANSSPTTVKYVGAGHPMITTQVPTRIATHQAKSARPATQVNPSSTSLLKATKSTLKDGDRPLTSKAVQETNRPVPELTSPERLDPSSPARDTKDAPRNLDSLETVPGKSDKSGLVAALVFGVMFLLLVIGLVSHKVSEARRRHRYTKLDYLINGMYVDT